MPLGEPEVDDELPPVPPPQPVELREPQLLRDEPSRYAGGVGGHGVADLPPGEPVLPPVYNGETTGTTAEPVLLQDAQDMVLRDRNHPSIILWSLCNGAKKRSFFPNPFHVFHDRFAKIGSGQT